MIIFGGTVTYMKNVMFTFQLPEELMNKTNTQADEEMISTAALIRKAITMYLKSVEEK